MKRNAHFDQLDWLDRFEDDQVCFLAPEGDALESMLDEEVLANVESCFLIKTSGSSGLAKWVVHEKSSLLKHASFVNTHLGVCGDDVFGLILPVYHVGGLGIIARAYVSGASLVSMKGEWSAKRGITFLLENNVSVVSLVPTQLVDIVSCAYQCPESVRVLVVGGGGLAPEVLKLAIDLGWPVSESYGMTETGSQIATGRYEDEGYLSLIDGWQVRQVDDGILEVKGDCLFKGYLSEGVHGLEFIDPRVEGWFRTSDRVALLERDGEIGIRFLGRSDQKVKVLGELVDVSVLEIKLAEILAHEVFIISLKDERRGVRLYPVIDDVSLSEKIIDLGWRGLHGLEDSVVVENYPRNSMGKLSRAKLAEAVESIVFCSD